MIQILKNFFKILNKSEYSGDLIIQGSRIEKMEPEQKLS